MESIDRRMLAGHFSIDQLMVLDAVDRAGSVLNAAKLMKRAHSALLRSIRQVEEIAGADVLDRSGYRLSLNSFGQRLLATGRQILRLESELLDLAEQASGIENPNLSIVYDGALNPESLISAAASTLKSHPHARLNLFSAHLNRVEAEFESRQADVLITLVKPQQSYAYERKLPSIKNHLVAKASHSIVQRRQNRQELLNHPLLVVSSGAEALYGESFAVDVVHQIQLADFHAKRQALLHGLGYGWMPFELIEKDLHSDRLKQVRWEGESTFTVSPMLYLRRPVASASRLIQTFVQNYLSALER